MSSALQLYGKGYSKADKHFKFVLCSSGQPDLELHYAPKGWNESELTFIRDKFYKGVIQSYSTNELTFVKDGRDFVQTAYETSGIDHEVIIIIYIRNNSTFSYQLYFSGKLDLSTYKIDSIGVTCDVIPTGFQNIVLNRDEIDVDMVSTKSIGGADGDTAYLSTVPENVTIPEYDSTQNADWQLTGTLLGFNNSPKYFSFPMTVNYTEYDYSEVFNQDFEIIAAPPTTTKILKSNVSRTVKFSGYLDLSLTTQTVPDTFLIDIYLTLNGAIFSTHFAYSIVTDGLSVLYSYYFDQTLVLSPADEVGIIGRAYSTSEDFYIAIDSANLFIIEDLGIVLPAISNPMYYIFEAFTRTLQLITGVQNPFESKFLGRTDSVPVSYPTDGLGSLISITNGKLIRGFDARTTQLNFSLKDLFTTLNAIHNIGLGFETISGDLKVRVEEEKYFFDITENSSYPTESQFYKVNQILDLSSWLNNEMISKEVLPDWYANEVESGYNSFEYEKTNGLKEYNTKSSYAIPKTSIKSKLSFISAYRADTQGVNKLRAKPRITFATEDVDGDNDNFVFDVKRAGVTPVVFTVKTDEDFLLVNGGVIPDSSYNLNFTPRRNLERHGNRIESMKLKTTDEIQWLKSDKNTALNTKRYDETEIKAENGNILSTDLIKGYWIPEAYIFEAPVNLATVTALQANPRGVIKIASDKYGWILDVQTNNEKKKGTFKLLRVNLTNVKVIPTPVAPAGIGTAEIELNFIIT